MPNFSFLACLEVAEKFVVVGGGGWITWLLCLTHIDNQPKMVLYVATFCLAKMLVNVGSYTNTHDMCKSTDPTFTNTHIQSVASHI